MRNLFLGAGLALTALFGVPAMAAEDFQAGKQYTELRTAQPVSVPGKIEVVEVFWYGCPACNMFEGVLKPWAEKLPEDVHFVQVPAQFNEVLNLHARLYYTLEVLKVEAKVHEAVFAGIHEKKDPRVTPARDGRQVTLPTPEQLADFVAEQGVDKALFLKTYDSFAVRNRLAKADKLVRSYQITGVPELVVNGKYRIELQKAGGFEQMLQIADFLIKKERATQ